MTCHVIGDGTVVNLHAVLRLSEGELCVCLLGGNDMLQVYCHAAVWGLELCDGMVM